MNKNVLGGLLVIVIIGVAAVGIVGGAPVVKVPVGSSWSLLAWGWQDGGKDNMNGKVVDIDLDTQKNLIQNLTKAGKIVICYFSTGTLEPWRADCQANKAAWQDAAVGQMADWDEAWLDIRKLDKLKALMLPRFQRAASQGCHGVEPDNIDCYSNTDCYGSMINPAVANSDAVKQAQILYNEWQVNISHSLGLAIGMKNAMGLVSVLSPFYDFAVNEQCQSYSECSGYSAFTNANKAVLQVEYTSKADWCKGATTYKMETKYCSGSNSDGICKSGSWTNCFSPTSSNSVKMDSNSNESSVASGTASSLSSFFHLFF
eukprot:TRINITY_DN4101_c0_g1_i1.p1 TRINITY_DN4101_c0_g1~~TRINITY_DN4101_c0_g1_i1.p1  ORF type:complete len:316 (+),score=61.03 TRINITY_DN4101_c0_g1_i1:109-1056(+)